MDQLVLQTLYQISVIAASARDLPSLWEPLFKLVLKTLEVDAGTIMTLEGEYLTRRVAIGMGEEIMKEPPIPSSKGGISWGVVQSKKPAVITDLSKAKIASKALTETMHSLVTVPMITRGQVVGVMSVFTKAERNFSEKDVNFFTTIANQAAMAIVSLRSAELLEENRKRLAELGALNELSKSIGTLFNFEETLFSIIGLITRLLRADSGVIILYDHNEKLLRATRPAFGLNDVQVRDLRMRSDEGISGQAFCKGVPIMANRLDDETKKVFARAGISAKSTIASPIRIKSQTMGVIQIFSEKEDNFREADLRLFGILASQAAVVVNSSKMLREIEEERKKDSALLASIGEGVLAVDAKEKIILLNSAGEQITGYLQEELLANTLLETLGLWDKDKKIVEEKASPIKKVLADGKTIILNEIYLKKHDGTLFPAYLSIAATRDADDKIIGAIVVFRDITSELEVEQMKQELISIATHELRTPITGIKGYLDMILAGDAGELSPDLKEMLEEITKINQRLADLVDDLLNVGRIEQGRIEIKPVKMDLSKLIQEATDEMQIQAKDKGLNLKSQISNLKIMVKGDPERVRQVLINLIGNAIKYTPTGSVTVTTEKKDKEIITSVKDTGLGMNEEQQRRLFEKFYRVKNDQTRAITGTGLGLWITKQLVEKQGGKIWLESQEGKGSTFSFSLPRA